MPDVWMGAAPTVYDGSVPCRECGRVVDPLTALYNGDLCTMDKRRAAQRLVANKRVGAL